MDSFQIRTAQAADLDPVRDVFRRSSLSNEGDRDNLLTHPEVLELGGASIGEGRMRVAVEGGRIIGFATTAGVGEVVEIEDLFVDPDRMRRGVARALMQDIAAAAGGRRVEVTANPHAVAFYAACGFVRDDDVETRFGPAPRMHLVMEPPPARR